MSNQENLSRFDGIKWLLVALLIGASVYGNWYFATEDLIYRLLGLLLMAVLAVAIAVQTQTGANIWTLLRESRTEILKVIWPTPQETSQTTVIVVILTLFVALILWLLDWGLGTVVEALVG